jgi:hypothetical protein
MGIAALHPSYDSPTKPRRKGEHVKNLFHVKRGWSTTLSFERRRGFSIVIASDKREAFAQGSDSDEAVHASASCGMEWIASLRSQ